MNDICSTERRLATPDQRRPEGVRELLQNRWVRLILAVTVAFSVVARLDGVGGSTVVAEAAQPTFVAPPIVISEPGEVPTLTEAWRTRAVDRESRRMAAEYVQRGYRVSPELARSIHDAATRYEIEPEIAFGLVRAESSFRNSATSHVGAMGLTQLMPRTAAWIAPGTTRGDLRDPEKNLDVGFRYLRYLLDKYDGDTRLALLAYNRGPGTVDRVLRRGGNPDNGYVEMVMGTRGSKRGR